MKVFLKKYLLVAVLYLIAAFIYIVYRSNETFLNQVMLYLVGQERFLSITTATREQIRLNYFLIYSFPAGVWIFCTTIITRKMEIKKSLKCYFLFIPLVMVLVIEMLQYLKLTNGYFDWQDVSVAIISCVGALYIPLNKEPIQKNFTLLTVLYLIVYFSNA